MRTTIGVTPRLRPVAGRGEAILRDGRLRAVELDAPLRLLRSPLLSRRARWRLPRLPLELLRHRTRLDPLHPERAAALDGETFSAGATRVLDAECLEFLLGPIFASTFDADPEDLSWDFGLLAMRLASGGFRMQCYEGGNGLLTRTLAERVSVRTGCDVVRVETETDGARIR